MKKMSYPLWVVFCFFLLQSSCFHCFHDIWFDSDQQHHFITPSFQTISCSQPCWHLFPLQTWILDYHSKCKPPYAVYCRVPLVLAFPNIWHGAQHQNNTFSLLMVSAMGDGNGNTYSLDQSTNSLQEKLLVGLEMLQALWQGTIDMPLLTSMNI